MVICSKCQTRNSLDSAFCKHCGAETDASAVASEKSKIEELVAEGFRLFNEGRVDEARLIAEKAMEDLPEYSNALSLMGMCHERAGELNEALLCYEKIVELNPDSSLDKIKITQLRNLIAAKLIAPPEPSRKRAFVGAIAATLLVVSMGVALAGFISSQNKPEAQAAQKPTLDPGLQANLNGGQPQYQANQQPNGNPQGGQPTGNAGQGNPGSEARTNTDSGSSAPPIRPNSNVGEIPGVGPFPIGNVSIQPENNTQLSGGNSSASTGATNTTTNSSPAKPDVNDPDVETQPVKPPKKTGVIEITVDNGNTARPGGSVPIDDNPNQMQALLQAARQQYLTGKYDLAAKAYEQALRAGADPAATNQRLGQCYEKLNRNSDAVQAYSRAVQAAQAQLSSGGNKERLQNLIDSCQQALKVLRGG